MGAGGLLLLEEKMSKVPLTVAGAEKLREELHRLKTVERPNVIAAIAEARSHGDLSENAEYAEWTPRTLLSVHRSQAP